MNLVLDDRIHVLSHAKELKLHFEGNGKPQMTFRNTCVGPDQICPEKDCLKGDNKRQGQWQSVRREVISTQVREVNIDTITKYKSRPCTV